MAIVLLDSNIIINAHKGGDTVALAYLTSQQIACSAISRVETLGFPQIRQPELIALTDFFDVTLTFDVDDDVINLAAAIRRRRNVGLGDAIIAATAIEHDLTLATANTRDFAWIEQLAIVNPYVG